MSKTSQVTSRDEPQGKRCYDCVKPVAEGKSRCQRCLENANERSRRNKKRKRAIVSDTSQVVTNTGEGSDANTESGSTSDHETRKKPSGCTQFSNQLHPPPRLIYYMQSEK
jgi:hypothetical protein